MLFGERVDFKIGVVLVVMGVLFLLLLRNLFLVLGLLKVVISLRDVFFVMLCCGLCCIIGGDRGGLSSFGIVCVIVGNVIC